MSSVLLFSLFLLFGKMKRLLRFTPLPLCFYPCIYREDE